MASSREELEKSINEYKDQLSLIEEALKNTEIGAERDSLLSLQTDLRELIQLTQENLNALLNTEIATEETKTENKHELDDEYALFMEEMSKSGAYNKDNNEESQQNEKLQDGEDGDSDIEDELSTLLGMKCSVYHTHKWGGQPTLHNAMVSSIVPRQDSDQFHDLQVRVLFTHPTHAEMLPCPFFLDGECRFSDEQCRFSHGAVIALSNLKEAIEPNFESVRVGSRVLVKLRPPDGEDISLTRKSTEKYHLWHRALVKSVDVEKKQTTVKLEHGIKTGEKRKTGCDEFPVPIELLFPLDNDTLQSDSEDSLSDTEYPEQKTTRMENEQDSRALLIEKSLQTSGPAIGEWERHTRGIGSKLMLAMGYVPGTGLGAAGEGRVQPVEARLVPKGKTLDHCMAISEKAAGQDPLKIEQKLKRLQKREEERNKRAYEREKERERRNVFNFLNKTLGDKSTEEDTNSNAPVNDIKKSTNRDLNIEQFKINEETKRIEKELLSLNSSLQRHGAGINGRSSLNVQIAEKTKQLTALRNKEQQIVKEQTQRKDKKKMTVF